MIGYVQSYNSVNGLLSLVVTKRNGSGTFSDWTISLAVDPRHSAPLPHATTTGSGLAYLANFDPVIAVDDGFAAVIRFHVDCSANATIQFNGQLPVLDIKIKRSDGTYAPVASGDIKANDTLIVLGVESGTSILVEPSVARSNINYITANTTLTLENSLDITHVVNATATLTLPALSAFVEGGSFNVVSNATATINRSGSDVISLFNADVTTMIINDGEHYSFVKSAGKWLAVPVNARQSVILSTPTVTTSGTSWTSPTIPSWCKKVKATLVGFSTNGTSLPLFQLISGSPEITGYQGTLFAAVQGGNATVALSDGFTIEQAWTASYVKHGEIEFSLHNKSSNTWVADGSFSNSDQARHSRVTGSKSLASALTAIRLTMANGTDAGDAGSITWGLE
jgi:hypothetical protein